METVNCETHQSMAPQSFTVYSHLISRVKCETVWYSLTLYISNSRNLCATLQAGRRKIAVHSQHVGNISRFLGGSRGGNEETRVAGNVGPRRIDLMLNHRSVASVRFPGSGKRIRIITGRAAFPFNTFWRIAAAPGCREIVATIFPRGDADNFHRRFH